MKIVVVTGAFYDIRSRDIRFLEVAAEAGALHVQLWSDATIGRLTGKQPRFTEEERKYFLESVRYVDQVIVVDAEVDKDAIMLPRSSRHLTWAVMDEDDTEAKRSFCDENQVDYQVISDELLARLPLPSQVTSASDPDRTKVVVTGCFDWLHSGHVRFFEETSELGDLFVVLGHDENVKLLKGEGHPQFSQSERRYMVQAIRTVKQALISSGSGWMDAEPEIDLLRPDIYAVNEDGDKPEKRAFCEAHGLDYIVLKRLPKVGLPRRTSTDLRGF